MEIPDNLQSKDTALILKIKHTEPIEIRSFINTMDSLAFLFEDYSKKAGESSESRKIQLYVEKVEHGSIEIHLVEIFTCGILPFIINSNIILEFGTHLKDTIEWLIGKSKKKERVKYSVNELKALKGLFDISSESPTTETEIGIIDKHEPNIIFNNCTFNYNESKEAQKRVSEEIVLEASRQANEEVYQRQLMTIFQMRTDLDSKIGNKAIIEAISKKNLNLFFETPELQQKIIGSEENPAQYAYLVDVVVQRINEKPFAYKVINLHEKVLIED